MQISHATLIALVLSSFAVVHAQQTTPPTPKPAAPASHGQGQKPSTPAMEHPSSISGGDRTFMTKAAAAGHKEIELAKVAEQKATSSGVKALAERLQKDHEQADQE